MSKDSLYAQKYNFQNALNKIDNVKSKFDEFLTLISNKENFNGLTYIEETIKYAETAMDSLVNSKVNIQNAIYNVEDKIANFDEEENKSGEV